MRKIKIVFPVFILVLIIAAISYFLYFKKNVTAPDNNNEAIGVYLYMDSEEENLCDFYEISEESYGYTMHCSYADKVKLGNSNGLYVLIGYTEDPEEGYQLLNVYNSDVPVHIEQMFYLPDNEHGICSFTSDDMPQPLAMQCAPAQKEMLESEYTDVLLRVSFYDLEKKDKKSSAVLISFMTEEYSIDCYYNNDLSQKPGICAFVTYEDSVMDINCSAEAKEFFKVNQDNPLVIWYVEKRHHYELTEYILASESEYEEYDDYGGDYTEDDGYSEDDEYGEDHNFYRGVVTDQLYFISRDEEGVCWFSYDEDHTGAMALICDDVDSDFFHSKAGPFLVRHHAGIISDYQVVE